MNADMRLSDVGREAAAGSPVHARRFGAAAVPVAAIIAVLLFFTVARGVWLVFLLPATVALFLGSRSR